MTAANLKKNGGRYLMAMIIVDGAEMPCPSVFDWGLQDISASESGRTDDTIMHKTELVKNGRFPCSGTALIEKRQPKYCRLSIQNIFPLLTRTQCQE